MPVLCHWSSCKSLTLKLKLTLAHWTEMLRTPQEKENFDLASNMAGYKCLFV